MVTNKFLQTQYKTMTIKKLFIIILLSQTKILICSEKYDPPSPNQYQLRKMKRDSFIQDKKSITDFLATRERELYFSNLINAIYAPSPTATSSPTSSRIKVISVDTLIRRIFSAPLNQKSNLASLVLDDEFLESL